MRKKERKYKLIIGALLAIIALQGIVFIASRPKKPVIVKRPREISGRIAIVIDDWGYNLRNLNNVSEIKYPLTIAVLPSLSYSRELAEELRKSGFEVILHLPMEPHEKYRLEKNTLMTNFNEEEIKKIMDGALTSIAYAKGVSNHMGSKATEDRKTMGIIFKELKKRHLYFLDSYVSPESVCQGLAKEMDLDFAKRDIFLDNEEDPLYIRQQLDKLKKHAKARGSAIGIGHDRRVTLEVLKEVMPKFEKEGYKFVFVSDLLKQ
ncbi:MAG: divergent polysaccharide deacetylase family protein [Candidatus Omnitrophota bacterium]